MSYWHAEYDHANLIEQENDELEIFVEQPSPGEKYLLGSLRKSWYDGYIPPYRAAYFRAGN